MEHFAVETVCLPGACVLAAGFALKPELYAASELRRRRRRREARRIFAPPDSLEHFNGEMLCGVEQGETEAATPEQPQFTCGVQLRRRETCEPDPMFWLADIFESKML